METHPVVSVIIPTYNYARFICEAIESILASSFPLNEIEIIVIDDGSTDDTAEKVKVYEAKVKYILQDNQGKAWATKVGIEHARGKYIFNLDADDLFLPEKLQKVVEVFEKDRDCVHVAHPAIGWNVDDNIKAAEPVPSVILGRKMLGKDLLTYFYKKGILFGGGSTFAARAEVLKQLVIPKEVDMFIDEYLVVGTLKQGYSFFIEEPLSIWRIHGQNFSQKSSSDNSYKLNLKRSVASVEAVLANLSHAVIEEEIKVLYQLKEQVLILFLKEKIQEKSLLDIWRLWVRVINTFKLFGLETFQIMKHYHVLNRTMPNFLVILLKNVLNK